MGITIENSWHFTGGLWQDTELKKVKESALHYRPEPIGINELGQDTLWTLRGPRRSGKTVSLKLLVADLIEKGQCSPREIVWTSVETLRTLDQLDKHFTEVLNKFHPRYFFCDEITSIIGWQKVVKKLRDNGSLSNTCTLLTGSSSFDLKKGSERLAGRKGVYHSTDRVLLPMGFGHFKTQCPQFTIEDYLFCGGFPFRVEEAVKCKTFGKKFDFQFGASVLDDIFFYEIARRRLDRNLALEIISRLSQTQPHAISYLGFSKSLNMKADTAKKYLDALGDSFLLATIHSYDTGRSRVALKKDRKLIWVDSALSFFAYSLGQGDQPKSESLAEQAVGVHLLRNFELRLFEGLSAPRHVFTWKSKSGKEIDYLLVNKAERIRFPVEVKFQNAIAPSDFISLEKAFHCGLLVTKDASVVRNDSKGCTLETFCLQNKKDILG